MSTDQITAVATFIADARAKYKAATRAADDAWPEWAQELVDAVDQLPAALDALAAVLAKCDRWATESASAGQQSAAIQIRDAIHLAVFP